jgi:octaprenyl-diphosphate synthase
MQKKIQDIFLNLQPDLKKIDELILQFAVGKSPLIQEISNHLISSGGKRIRPVLLILSSQLFQLKNPVSENCYNLAAAVELIHSATLLHDDVVDVSEVRRGKKTANALWDNKASILVGDYLFSISFQLMVKSKNLRVLDLLSKASSIMADGEVMQLQNSNDITLSQEKYLEIIFGKTAVLFSAACEAGALIVEAKENEILALAEFGKNLGIIFQIVDDILDYSSQEKVLGKDVGNDFFEGKITLPILLTYNAASNDEKKNIAEIFTRNLMNKEKNHHDFVEILSIMKKYNGLEASRNMALQYKDLAIENLQIFSNSNAKENLLTILNYSLERIY